ncbi:MAG: flagellar export protein FliJ [Caulobacteraceae bacterium]|nr:flagellar export protein FliJ [Caulobacteraceae bacterium]
MSWQASLVKLANHDVETLRKRLTEVLDRRAAIEARLVALAAEVQAEMAHADRDAAVGLYRAGFLKGAAVRRDRIQTEIDAVALEEAGARDALGQAFESLKKFEHVAETARLAGLKKAARIEAAAMDEMGLRKRAR